MQTLLTEEFADSARGREAEGILRKCVHCGFCNATCPTYQLLGDELDGPRGRIYQIKLVVEGAEPTVDMQKHLDRCLTCRSCETTCPSGVQYSKLLEIGKEIVDERVPRSFQDKIKRKALTNVIPRPALFGALVRVGQKLRGVLPKPLAQKIPVTCGVMLESSGSTNHKRKMIMLEGCAQPALAPQTNAATKQVLDQMGIATLDIDGAGCCGAVSAHTGELEKGKQAARSLIDLWYPHIEQGVEAFVMTASGCGVSIKEYPSLLKDDPNYFDKAVALSEKTFDLSEVIERELQSGYHFPAKQTPMKVAFHAPCTLQHGQQIKGKVEKILMSAGYELCNVNDPHLCCGSAGTYSLLQPEIANQLRENKQSALQSEQPDIICTANVGCQSWLNVDSKTPVRHWAELLV